MRQGASFNEHEVLWFDGLVKTLLRGGDACDLFASSTGRRVIGKFARMRAVLGPCGTGRIRASRLDSATVETCIGLRDVLTRAEMAKAVGFTKRSIHRRMAKWRKENLASQLAVAAE